MSLAKYFTCFGMLLMTQLASAKQDAQSSLEAIKERIASTQGLERTELQLQWIDRQDNSPQDRIDVANIIIDEHQNKDDSRILALALKAKGTGLGQLGDFANAIAILAEAEVEAKKCADANPEIFLKARSNRALYLAATGNKTESVGLLLELIEFAKPFGDRLSVGHAYLTLASLAENSGSTAKAFEYLQTSFELSTRANQAYVAGAAAETIVALSLAEGQFESAEKWIESAQAWVDKSNSPGVIFSFAMRREELRTSMGDANMAADNLRKLLRSASPNIEPQMVGLAFMALANAEIQLKNYGAAAEAAKEAVSRLRSYPRSRFLAERARLEATLEMGDASQVAEELTKMIGESDAFDLPTIRLRLLMSRAHERLGNYPEALAELRKANLLETRRLKERAQEQMNFMTAIFEDRERESQITLLKEKQVASDSHTKRIQAEIEQQSQAAAYATQTRNVVIALCGIVLVASTILLIAFFRLRETRQIATREKQLNDELTLRYDQQAIALRREEETRRRLELTVERKQRDEAMGKLTGGVAHDFNNLLTVILNSNKIIMMSEENLTESARQFLSSSTKAAQSGAAIIQQLMSYARQQPLTPVPVKVSDWLRSVQGLFRQTVGESCTWSVKDSSDGAVIGIDNARLTTAIINLLANAKDAIESNGCIELSIQRIHLSKSEPNEWGDSMDGEYVRFEVRDNGIGIPPELIRQVCDPFFTTKQSKSGTGLGLSSVLGFVRQSRGEFGLESELGKGTVAKFILPLCHEETKAMSTKVSANQKNNKGSILIVEDEESVRKATSFLLKMQGYQVFEADSADAAVRFFQESELPKIVFSDVQMPGSMDGLGLRNWIQVHYPTVRVILTSGYVESQNELGQDFLLKPYSLTELSDILYREAA